MKTLQFFVCTIFCLSVLFAAGCDSDEHMKGRGHYGTFPAKSTSAESESSDQQKTTSTQEKLL